MKDFKMLFGALVALFLVFSIMQVSLPNSQASEPRNYEYEAYCDSIWENDKDFYLDVIVESQQYQDYLEAHGEWWR